MKQKQTDPNDSNDFGLNTDSVSGEVSDLTTPAQDNLGNSSSDTEQRCSQCGKPFLRSETKCMPFCSKRCQQVDLGRWLDEAYGLPVEGHEESDFERVDDDLDDSQD